MVSYVQYVRYYAQSKKHMWLYTKPADNDKLTLLTLDYCIWNIGYASRIFSKSALKQCQIPSGAGNGV